MTTNTPDELKPCPFCYGRGELIDARLQRYVKCTNCTATVIGQRMEEPEENSSINWGVFERSAITAWNIRTPNNPNDNDVEQLEEIARTIARESWVFLPSGFIERLAKAISAMPQERSGWRAIEEAPKDGTMILVAFHGEQLPFWYMQTTFWGGGQWQDIPQGIKPMWFQPLPSPPITKTGEE